MPQISTLYGYVTGVAAATADIRSGTDARKVVVMDWIVASCTGPALLIIDVEGYVVAKRQVAAADSNYISIDFNSGWPLWTGQNTEITPMTAASVTATATGGTATTLLYGYHYENESARRSQS